MFSLPQLFEVVGRDVVARLEPVEVFKPVARLVTGSLQVSRRVTVVADLVDSSVNDADSSALYGQNCWHVALKNNINLYSVSGKERSFGDLTEEFDPLSDNVEGQVERTPEQMDTCSSSSHVLLKKSKLH